MNLDHCSYKDATDDYIAGCGNTSLVTFSYSQDTVGTEGDFQDVDSDVGNYAELCGNLDHQGAFYRSA